MTKSVDVLVAGSGGTGLAAAAVAAKAGLKVLVVEKLAAIGGNTRISSGFFAVDTKFQREAGLKLSKQEAIERVMLVNDYLANGSIVNKIINSAEEALYFVESLGMDFHLNPTENTTQFAHRGDHYKGGSYHQYVDKDASYAKIQKTLEDLGVVFQFETTFKAIHLNEQGAVASVTLEDKAGDQEEVETKAVVVATGGFGANTKKVAAVMKTDRMRSLGVPSFGEGLEAMEAVGAVDVSGTALIHAAQLKKSTVTQKTAGKTLAGFSNNLLTQVLLSPLLWVNDKGQRFTNEDVVYDTVWWSNAGWSVGGEYYIAVDTATLKKYSVGTVLEVSKSGPGATSDLGDFVAAADRSVEQGTAFKGNTIEELAAAAGMAPETLKDTFSRYNQAIADKNDKDFGKSATSLEYSLEEGPYYLITAQVAYLGTVGGVRVDADMEVLDENLKPIPGLFTGGANADGYYKRHSYPPYEGMASGFAWTSGKIAGESAVKYVNK